MLKKAGLDSNTDFEKAADVTRTALSKFEPIVYEDIKKKAPEILANHRNYASDFNERLMERWKQPIDLLELLLISCTEMGSSFNASFRKVASKNNDFLFDVLVRQHARACLIGCEILTLTKNGLADGAFARWRSLHESVVISFFIAKHKQDLPERFLNYEVIESYKQALEYQKCCERLGEEPVDSKDLQVLSKIKDDVLTRYGKDFYRAYGWVPLTILPNNKRNFAGIESSLNMEHLRPYYRMSCFGVHSGPKSIKFNLGLIKSSPKNQLILAGPSNYGLADPIKFMAFSLYQITVCLLATKPNVERLITIGVIKRLVDEISELSVNVQRQIEKEEDRKDQ